MPLLPRGAPATVAFAEMQSRFGVSLAVPNIA
jgi:hypothetical protein